MLKYSPLFCLLFLFSCNNGREVKSELVEAGTPKYDSVVFGDFRNYLKETGDSTALSMMDSLKDYHPVSGISPNYLTSDFSGDGQKDYAVFTQNSKDNQYYFIFIHSEGEHYRIGGGDGMMDGDLTLEWVTGIEVFKDRETNQSIIDEETGDILGTATINLARDAVALKYGDSGTVGLLYWDGTNYTYIHQFD